MDWDGGNGSAINMHGGHWDGECVERECKERDRRAWVRRWGGWGGVGIAGGKEERRARGMTGGRGEDVG